VYCTVHTIQGLYVQLLLYLLMFNGKLWVERNKQESVHAFYAVLCLIAVNGQNIAEYEVYCIVTSFNFLLSNNAQSILHDDLRGDCISSKNC